MDTLGSPRSTLMSVGLLIEARCAAMTMGMRRRRRASLRSWPSLRSARRTGIGRVSKGVLLDCLRSTIVDLNVNTVNYKTPYVKIVFGVDCQFNAMQTLNGAPKNNSRKPSHGTKARS